MLQSARHQACTPPRSCRRGLFLVQHGTVPTPNAMSFLRRQGPNSPPAPAESWIPACAGMTSVGVLHLARATQVESCIQLGRGGGYFRAAGAH